MNNIQNGLADLKSSAAELASKNNLHPRWENPTTDSERRVVEAWLQDHVHDLYRVITNLGEKRPRIGEIVREAGNLLPQLFPNSEVLARDAERPTGRKLHLERDQAILVHAVLMSPTIRQHALDSMRMPLKDTAIHLNEFKSTGIISLPTILVERKGFYAEITLNNTNTLNAETNQTALDLEIAVDVATLANCISVGVIRGAPMTHVKYAGQRVFSAGINLKHLSSGEISYLDFFIGREAGLLSKMVRGVIDPDTSRSAQLPWICVIDTFAIGGGMQIALAADYVAASPESFMSLPAAKEGIIPGVANLRLPSRIGPTLSRDIILRGRKLDALEALETGLVNAVVPEDVMTDHIMGIASDLASPSVSPNKAMLSLGIEPLDHFAVYLAEFALVQSERMNAEDVVRKALTL